MSFINWQENAILSNMIKIIPVVIFLFMLSCSEENKVSKTIEYDPATQPDQISYDVVVDFIDSSFTKAILYAGRARIFERRSETLLDSSVEVHFFKKETGKKASVLTSRKARIDDRTMNMIAEEDVVVVGKEREIRLETEILEWNNSTRKLYSTEFVEITTEDEIIRGYGFESDPNLTNYKIFKVSGIQKINEARNE